MIYLKNFEDKIYKHVVLTAPEKLVVWKRIIKTNFEVYSKVEDVDQLKDHKICEDICDTYTTDNQIRIYFATTWNAATNKKRVEYII